MVHGARLDCNCCRRQRQGCVHQDARLAGRTPRVAAGRHLANPCRGAKGRRLEHGRARHLAWRTARHDSWTQQGCSCRLLRWPGSPCGKGVARHVVGALLHVLSGFAVFLALRYTVGQSPSFLERSSPGFIVVGYGLIVVSGVIMLVQSLRAGSSVHDGSHALTAGIGLLPCRPTISVLGFAWTQSSVAMVGLVVLSLALGISLTSGAVAVLAILARNTMGAVLAHRAHQFERGARIAQALAALAIIVIGTYAIAALLR